MRRFKVSLWEPIHKDGLAILQEKCDVELIQQHDEDFLVETSRDKDAIIKRDRGLVTPRIMDAAPNLKVVGRHGAGVECIDVKAATERGILVVNTPEANCESVAEHCIGMLIALSKKMLQADKRFRQGKWEVRYQYVGQEMRGRTLGVIGLGRIGRRVAEICRKAFYMRVLYHDARSYPEVERELQLEKRSLDEVLAESDYVSVHVPLTAETQHMIGEREFRLMKPGAYFINSSRGPVVDEAALVRALTEGWIAGAGLDVYEEEPTPASNPLLSLENVIVTPHMAAHTDDALRNMSMVVVDVINVLEGRAPKYPVNRPLNPRAQLRG